MKPTILQVDDLDSRREIWHCLHRLSPKRRLAFVAWCCDRVTRPGHTRPAVTPASADLVLAAYRCDNADLRLSNECYTDILFMGSQYQLDLVAAAVFLEQCVKKPHLLDRPPPSPSSAPPASSSSVPRAASARSPCSTG